MWPTGVPRDDVSAGQPRPSSSRSRRWAAGARVSSESLAQPDRHGKPNLLENPSLESETGDAPACWLLGGYGQNTFTWTRTTDDHSGGHAERLDVTRLMSGDRKLVSAQSG